MIFVLWLALAVGVGYLASQKGRSGAGWTFLAILISPLLAVLALLVVGEAKETV